MFRSLQKLILTMFFTAFAAQASAMFVQPDWLEVTEPGVGTNRYSYSGNDPINRADKNGNLFEEAMGFWGGFIDGFRQGPYGFSKQAPAPIGRASEKFGAELDAMIGIGVGNVLGSAEEPGNKGITSGNPEVDGVFGGFDDSKGRKGQSYPGTQGELQGELSGLPGADTGPQRPDGGVTIEVDGTKVDLYPGRTSTQKPGFQITKPGASKPTIKGSAEGIESPADNETEEEDSND